MFCGCRLLRATMLLCWRSYLSVEELRWCQRKLFYKLLHKFECIKSVIWILYLTTVILWSWFNTTISAQTKHLFRSGSDGLVKLWTIKTNECVKTFDAHQDKVWALHGSGRDDMMVTGSADSTITIWKVSSHTYPVFASKSLKCNWVCWHMCTVTPVFLPCVSQSYS